MRMLLLLLLVPFCQYANAGPKVPSDCENLIDQVLSLAPEDYEMLEARGFKNAQSRFLYIGRGSEGLVLYDLNTATAVKFFKWPEDYENALAAYEILRSPSASSELKLVRLKSKNKKSLSIEMPYISDGIRFFDFYHSETYSATLKSKVISSFNNYKNRR